MQTPNNATENSYKFAPVAKETLTGERIVRPSLNYWQDAWRRLKKNRLAMAGLIILVALIVLAIIVPLFQATIIRRRILKLKIFLLTANIGSEQMTSVVISGHVYGGELVSRYSSGLLPH